MVLTLFVVKSGIGTVVKSEIGTVVKSEIHVGTVVKSECAAKTLVKFEYPSGTVKSEYPEESYPVADVDQDRMFQGGSHEQCEDSNVIISGPLKIEIEDPLHHPDIKEKVGDDADIGKVKFMNCRPLLKWFTNRGMPGLAAVVLNIRDPRL